MSSELLKTSLRHTHAYIEAYGVELLEDVERLFRQALDQLDDISAESTQEDVTINFDAPTEHPTSSAPTQCAPQKTPSRHKESLAPRPSNFTPIAHWHFYLPAIVAGAAVTVTLLRGWLS